MEETSSHNKLIMRWIAYRLLRATWYLSGGLVLRE